MPYTYIISYNQIYIYINTYFWFSKLKHLENQKLTRKFYYIYIWFSISVGKPKENKPILGECDCSNKLLKIMVKSLRRISSDFVGKPKNFVGKPKISSDFVGFFFWVFRLDLSILLFGNHLTCFLRMDTYMFLAFCFCL